MMFVSRAEWGARPPTSPALSITSQGTTGHWEGGGIWGGVIGDHASCASKVRAIQAYHMDHQGWTDIAYNGVACPHGYVFEGRGPGKRSAANGTNTANGTSAVVCYLGGVGDPFPLLAKQAMLDAAQWLSGNLIWGHRDWFLTQCPGDEIYGWIHSGHPMPTVPTQGDDMETFTYIKKQGDNAVYLGRHGEIPLHVDNTVIFFRDAEYLVAAQGDKVVPHPDGIDVQDLDPRGHQTRKVLELGSTQSWAWFGLP